MSDDPITSCRFDGDDPVGSYRVYWSGKTIVTIEEMGEPHDHPKQKYEVGETVWLVSGGPPMNVELVGPVRLLHEVVLDAGYVETCWFDRAGHQHEGTFHVDQLTRSATRLTRDWDAWRQS